jgi:hypothetical protein
MAQRLTVKREAGRAFDGLGQDAGGRLTKHVSDRDRRSGGVVVGGRLGSNHERDRLLSICTTQRPLKTLN